MTPLPLTLKTTVELTLELFPIISFFIAYKLTNIFTATAILIGASLLQLAIFRLRRGKFEKSKTWLFLAILGFGGLTIVLHDAIYLKWKVSLVYFAIGAAFLASEFFGRQPLVCKALSMIDGDLSAVPLSLWKRLNRVWALIAFAIAIANYYFAFYTNLATWVNFKVFGLTAITFVVMLSSVLIVFKHLKPTAQTEPDPDK